MFGLVNDEMFSKSKIGKPTHYYLCMRVQFLLEVSNSFCLSS